MVVRPRTGRLDQFPSAKDNNDLYYVLHLSGCWDAMGAKFINAAIFMHD